MQQKSFIMLFFPFILPSPPSSVNLKTDGAKDLWENAPSLEVDSSTFTAELRGPQESFILIYSKT